ncbi:MAG: SufD family Fe-S cluster assembly protein [Selenomonadaceae bacterium]|nr:SufD family Fe-S cluster assembly protein [Selenomonadaceae bacterium]MDD7057184.1 SufD family Fe-S cluster assembly protein [Selenomonadaceae bacterium]MDY3916321.1 SufD family Fe-S cluster assembly protein [Selenomonadaceae bacterium]
MATANTAKHIFSEIPMRTWRWLGVNEVPEPENVAGQLQQTALQVDAGKQDEVVYVNRGGGAQDLTIDIAAGAQLHLINVQLAPVDAAYTSRIKVHVGEDAQFSYTVVEGGSRHTASELTVELAGDESRADVWGLYFGDGEQKIDLNYIIRQQGKRTDANMQVRGALLGHSEKTFRGTLDFLEGTKGSVGRENEEVTLLSDGVRNRSVPIMLSHEDDVDGHHAVSIGKMDEAKLFYLMSRGLDLAEAQRLVVEASFNPVLDRIHDEALRTEIDTYLKGRLAD